MESTSPATAAAASPRYAIDAMLRELATRPQRFVMRAREHPTRQVTLELTPLPDADGAVRRFRREVVVSRLGRVENAATGVGSIDLDRRTFVAVQAGAADVSLHDGAVLPASAAIGDHGPAFTTRSRTSHAGDAWTRTRVSWSLEAWDRDRALWALHMQPDAGAVTTTEGYVIDAAGTIHGAVMRVRDDERGRATELLSEELMHFPPPMPDRRRPG